MGDSSIFLLLLWDFISQKNRTLILNMLLEINTTERTCPHCGASMKVWRHSLSKGLVDVLVEFIGAVKQKGKNSIHLQNDMPNLTKNQYNNFQKLHYFGLVAKDDKNPGHWVITKWGGEFLRGERKIEKFALTFRDKLVEREGNLVSVKDFFPQEFGDDYWQSIFDFKILQGQLI